MFPAVPLVRRFARVSENQDTANKNADHFLWSPSKPTYWPDLMKAYRTVILAEAGAGKTFEMRAQANHMRNAGNAAFFIRIEDIDGGFTAAFEVGDATEFDKWLNASHDAWFFSGLSR